MAKTAKERQTHDETTEITKRFQELVEQMKNELGNARGSHKAVAGRLGLSPSYLTRVMNGQKRVGWTVVVDVCKRIGLPISAFMSGYDWIPQDTRRDLPARDDTVEPIGVPLAEIVRRAESIRRTHFDNNTWVDAGDEVAFLAAWDGSNLQRMRRQIDALGTVHKELRKTLVAGFAAELCRELARASPDLHHNTLTRGKRSRTVD